jgi:hypothetical protein
MADNEEQPHEQQQEEEEEEEEESVGFNFAPGAWNELIGEDIQYKVRAGWLKGVREGVGDRVGHAACWSCALVLHGILSMCLVWMTDRLGACVQRSALRTHTCAALSNPLHVHPPASEPTPHAVPEKREISISRNTLPPLTTTPPNPHPLKVLTPGHGLIAEVHMLLRCKYIGRLQATGQVFEVAEDTGYRIGDNDTTPALELGLRHMRKGEKGIVRCAAKYGYGPPGRPVVGFGGEVAVPEDAGLEYEIEVVDVLPPFNPKDAPLLTRVAEAELKKRHGNGFFHHLDYNRAIRCYQAGLKALDAESVDEEEEEEEVYRGMVKMFCDVSNNLAAALMKLERWKDAKVRTFVVVRREEVGERRVLLMQRWRSDR